MGRSCQPARGSIETGDAGADCASAVRRAADPGGPIQHALGKWRLIMRVVREIPAPIFDRFNF